MEWEPARLRSRQGPGNHLAKKSSKAATPPAENGRRCAIPSLFFIIVVDTQIVDNVTDIKIVDIIVVNILKSNRNEN